MLMYFIPKLNYIAFCFFRVCFLTTFSQKITKDYENGITVSSLQPMSGTTQHFLGLDSFAMSPIVNNAEDGPFT